MPGVEDWGNAELDGCGGAEQAVKPVAERMLSVRHTHDAGPGAAGEFVVVYAVRGKGRHQSNRI